MNSNARSSCYPAPEGMEQRVKYEPPPHYFVVAKGGFRDDFYERSNPPICFSEMEMELSCCAAHEGE